jgi:hypothetical protein
MQGFCTWWYVPLALWAYISYLLNRNLTHTLKWHLNEKAPKTYCKCLIICIRHHFAMMRLKWKNLFGKMDHSTLTAFFTEAEGSCGASPRKCRQHHTGDHLTLMRGQKLHREPLPVYSKTPATNVSRGTSLRGCFKLPEVRVRNTGITPSGH